MAVDVKKTILVELGIEKTQFLTDAASTQKQISSLADEQKKLKAAGQEATIEFQENASQLKLLKDELSTAQKSATNFEKAVNGQTGSLAQQKAELSILTAEYDKYSKAEKETSEEAKTLSEAIRKTSDSLKAEESALGNNSRNVGNYQGAIDNLKGSLGGYISQNQEISKLYPGLQSGLASFNDITLQFAGNQESLTQLVNLHKEALNFSKVAQQAKTAADIAEKEATLAGIAATEGKITVSEAAIIQTRAQKLATEAQVAATVAQTAATNTGTAAMKIFKVALASTGIGVIIILVLTLIDYFRKFTPVVDKVQQVIAGISAGFKVLQGAIASLFTDEPNESFKDLGDSISKAYKEAQQLEKAIQDLEDAMESQEIQSAKTRSEINRLNIQAKDRTKSEEERLKLLNKSAQLEKQEFEQRKKNANEAFRIAEQEIKIQLNLTDVQFKELQKRGFNYKEYAEKLGSNTDALFDKLKQAELDRIAIQDESLANQEKIINKQNKILEDQEAKREKAAEVAQAKREKAAEAKKVADEKIIADQKAIADELVKIEFDLSQTLLSQFNQQINITNNKYDQLEKKANGNKEVLARIETARKQEVDELILKNQKDLANQQFDLEKERLERSIASAKGNSQLELSLKIELLAKQRDAELEVTEQTEIQKLAIKERYQFQEQEVRAAFQIQQDQEKTDNAAKEIDRERQLTEAKEEFEARKREVIVQGLQLAQEIFAKNSVVGKLAFGLEKALALSSVITQTQKALAANRAGEEAQKAWLSAIPFVGPVLAASSKAIAIVQRGLITANGIKSGAQIAATTIKGFRYGGVYQSNSGGMVYGTGTSTSDSINARLSNGEAVMTARTVQMFKPQLSAMNVAGGGRALMPGGNKFAEGGIFDGGLSSTFRTLPVFNPTAQSGLDVNVLKDALTESVSEAVTSGMKGVTIITDVRDITSLQDREASNQNRVTL